MKYGGGGFLILGMWPDWTMLGLGVPILSSKHDSLKLFRETKKFVFVFGLFNAF